MRESDRKEIGRLLSAAAAKDRGYASFFDWPNKSSKEVHIAAQFAHSRSCDVGFVFHAIRRGPDPPDCEADGRDGVLIGIEVTELVDERAIRATKQGKTRVYPTWSPEKVVSELQGIVTRKSAANVPNARYAQYLLLVHTDEPELDIDYLCKALDGVSFVCRGCLTDAFLLVSYDPRIKKYPYIRRVIGSLCGPPGVG